MSKRHRPPRGNPALRTLPDDALRRLEQIMAQARRKDRTSGERRETVRRPPEITQAER